MYKVYCITAKNHYHGTSLVAADDAEEANKFIEDFQKIDKNNSCDSWGYTMVDEDDIIENIYSEEEGIVFYGIYYGG